MTNPPSNKIAGNSTQDIRRLVAWIVVGVAIAITVVAAIQARQRQLKKERTHSTHQVNDFDRWMTEVPQFLHQHVNYVSDSFPTPPVTLLAFAPLTWMSPPNAQFVWVCCKFFFATGIFLLALKMVRRTGVEPSVLALLLVLAVWLWPVLGDMQEGQTNLLMLLPLTAGLWLIQKDDWPGQGLGGLLVALAICIKVTPIIFLIYLLWQRRFLASLGVLVGMGVWLLAVPGLAFGWHQNMLWLNQWVHIMILPYVEHGRVEYYVGQSVPSFLSRLFRHVPAFIYNKHTGHPLPQYVNVLNLSRNVSDWLIRGILVVVGCVGLYWMRKRVSNARSRDYVLHIGAVAAFMLWASPRTWVPHYVSLIFTLMAVAMVLSDPAQVYSKRRQAALALAAAAFLMFLTTDIGKVLGPNGHRWLLTIGVSLWGSVLLMYVIFTAHQKPRKAMDTPPAGLLES